jgi:hypothetical protein
MYNVHFDEEYSVMVPWRKILLAAAKLFVIQLMG